MKLIDIFTFENLYESHKKCRLSKSHKIEVINFEANLSLNIYNIINEINTKKYKPGAYRRFLIHEPKERLIEALPYKDRVIIRCLCDNSIIPRINKRLIYDNVACRKGKGTLFGIKRLEKFLINAYRRKGDNDIYFLKCDIRRYFPSINHEILDQKLKKIGFSNDEMWLIERFIEGYNSYKRGLPLGNQTSQWFALLYLDQIDRLIKEKLQIKYYVRYMDDMILVHEDKNYLRYSLKTIEKVLKNELDLSLNQKTQIGKVSNGIDFLGYRHILTSKGKVIRKLRSSSKSRMKKHIKTLKKLKSKQIIDDNYVNIRKNAFSEHIKISNENYKFKQSVKFW